MPRGHGVQQQCTTTAGRTCSIQQQYNARSAVSKTSFRFPALTMPCGTRRARPRPLCARHPLPATLTSARARPLSSPSCRWFARPLQPLRFQGVTRPGEAPGAAAHTGPPRAASTRRWVPEQPTVTHTASGRLYLWPWQRDSNEARSIGWRCGWRTCSQHVSMSDSCLRLQRTVLSADTVAAGLPGRAPRRCTVPPRPAGLCSRRAARTARPAHSWPSTRAN